MKVAIISDLHLLHWQRSGHFIPLIDGLKRSLDKEKPNIIIDAGDVESEKLWWKHFTGWPLHRTHGNHDWYGKEWNDNVGPSISRSGKIVSTTLWTDFDNNNPVAHFNVQKGLADYRWIKGITTEKIYQTHLESIRLLENCANNDEDIIMTHHAPSYRSVAKKYKDDPLNPGFASNLDWLVEQKQPKIWLHGHMHDPADYMIGETRVICHPCGYPWERNTLYVPIYVEF